MCVRVCVRVCVCVRACERACERVSKRACERACERASELRFRFIQSLEIIELPDSRQSNSAFGQLENTGWDRDVGRP